MDAKILFSLEERPHRHGELRRHLGSVSQRMLTRTDNYDAEASPDPKWVEVSDAGEAAFRKRDAEAKA
jgi:hypothetical protein